MFRTDPRTPMRLTERTSPAHQAVFLSAGLIGVLSLAGYAMLSLPWMPALIFALIALVVLHGTVVHYPYQTFGMCNAVTLVRAAIVAFLLSGVFDATFPVWLFFGLASIAFAFDGVDGWLARRSGLVSDFGARFDMETDAALAAALALWILMQGTAGPAILVLGFARYAFVAASFALPALQTDLPDAFRRKAVCVFQIATLIVLALPITPPFVVPFLAILAAIAVVWSFAVDIVWLLRQPR